VGEARLHPGPAGGRARQPYHRPPELTWPVTGMRCSPSGTGAG
jgi:hypothetical protein